MIQYLKLNQPEARALAAYMEQTYCEFYKAARQAGIRPTKVGDLLDRILDLIKEETDA